MKSLLTDRIEVEIRVYPDGYYWKIINFKKFGFAWTTSGKDFKTNSGCKRNFERIAKLNGWKNYKWV